MPTVVLVDHRPLPGMAPPPRTHEEHLPAMQAETYRAAVRASLALSGAEVETDAEGTMHVYARPAGAPALVGNAPRAEAAR